MRGKSGNIDNGVLEEAEVAAGGEMNVGDAAAMDADVVVIPKIDVRLVDGDELLNSRENFLPLRAIRGDARLME